MSLEISQFQRIYRYMCRKRWDTEV